MSVGQMGSSYVLCDSKVGERSSKGKSTPSVVVDVVKCVALSKIIILCRPFRKSAEGERVDQCELT